MDKRRTIQNFLNTTHGNYLTWKEIRHLNYLLRKDTSLDTLDLLLFGIFTFYLILQ